MLRRVVWYIHHDQRLGLWSFPSLYPYYALALGSLFYPEDGHSWLLRNISNDLPDYTASHAT
jgi:hypothetical protein